MSAWSQDSAAMTRNPQARKSPAIASRTSGSSSITATSFPVNRCVVLVDVRRDFMPEDILPHAMERKWSEVSVNGTFDHMLAIHMSTYDRPCRHLSFVVIVAVGLTLAVRWKGCLSTKGEKSHEEA